jgi:chromosome segregation protein
MFVRALRLAGFKSFADPTALEFEPGVNVIVGPNGSGKSNIADALAWVLGSQAPSSLRGGSMEDVIFAGSANRPRLSFAEAALTLDNSSGVLPLDVSEVTITRSTDRSGLSEYRINGAVCRLLDILELLSDTGMGKSLHTVVGQGQLDAVLQARPEDRRSFIEEAAQIGKYRRRKDRSLRKIERVDDNLLRLEDVLLELQRAIRPLKRQARAAAQYSELVSEYTELRKQVTATDLHRLARQQAELHTERDQREEQLLSEELAHIRALGAGAMAEREQLRESAEKAQETASGLGRIADRLTGLARLARERTALIESRLAAETEEGYRERIRLLETQRIRWEKESSAGAAVAAVARERASSTRDKIDSARSDLDRAERDLATARRSETEAAQNLVRAEGSEAAGRATVGALEARVAAAVERREVAEREITTAAEAMASTERDITTLETELDRATESAADAETRLDATREKADSLKEMLGSSRSSAAGAHARVAALDEVAQVLADMPAAIERLEALRADARVLADASAMNEAEASGRVASADAEIEERWQEVGRHDEELRRLDALMAGASERLAGHRRQKEAREVERAALDEELARVRDSLASAEQAIVEVRAALPAHRSAVEQANETRSEAERRAAAARRALDTATEAAATAEVEARATEERALAARLRLEEAEAGIADAQTALEGLEELRTNLRALRDKVSRAGELAGYAASRSSGWAGDARGRAEAARTAYHDSERRLDEMRDRERSLEERSEALSRRRGQSEIRRAEMRARTEAVGERAMEEWGLSVDELMTIEALEDEVEPEARKRVEQLDRDMRRLGPVNPRASEEFEELAQRETFLKEQMEDLRASKRDLMRIVKEVDDTIVEVFGSAFQDVATEFEVVFERLFPGGTGRLRLIDPEDLLNSGIEVEARPAGKNVKKLSLLSGGERSLVALAFLFAIFRARPSPFYLLDEVEAALDDVNLSRFLGLIQELEEHAQVLVVTHQKRTMEAADVLYGVSMAKDGVSRVVAKRMSEIVL